MGPIYLTASKDPFLTMLFKYVEPSWAQFMATASACSEARHRRPTRPPGSGSSISFASSFVRQESIAPHSRKSAPVCRNPGKAPPVRPLNWERGPARDSRSPSNNPPGLFFTFLTKALQPSQEATGMFVA